MPLLLLIRHGENDFVKTGKLPGQSAGIHLNERGLNQVRALGDEPLTAFGVTMPPWPDEGDAVLVEGQWPTEPTRRA